MRTVVATLESVKGSPYSQSKYIQEPKKDGENPVDHEKRLWRERCHADENDNIFIPPMAFKNCLSEVAKFLSKKIPGKQNQTYTKHFEAGILVPEGISLPEKKATVKGEWLFVPSDGRRGGGKRVEKQFPLIPTWKGDLTVVVLDDTITGEVFKEHLEKAGAFIGIGRFRPSRNGYYGRFMVKDLIWQDQ